MANVDLKSKIKKVLINSDSDYEILSRLSKVELSKILNYMNLGIELDESEIYRIEKSLSFPQRYWSNPELLDIEIEEMNIKKDEETKVFLDRRRMAKKRERDEAKRKRIIF